MQPGTNMCIRSRAMSPWVNGLAAMLALLASTATAPAQNWPSRPLTLVVPFAAGGPSDVAGRILAQGLSDVLGQQAVVENPSGAGGTVGSLRVAKAPPDGYQFVIGNSGTHAWSQAPTTGAKRSSVLPDVPTAREQGIDFEVTAWQGLFLPKNTPDPIVRHLNHALSVTLDLPFVRERFKAIGEDVAPVERRSPEYFAKFVAAEIDRWSGPIKASGASVD